MLTQCPQCKTAFRLHVNQLKAAAGKVRCSRCNTTFDALDNLFVAPALDEEPAPGPATEQAAAPEPITEAHIGSPSVKKVTMPKPEDEERERITSLFDEPDAAPTADDADPLSHLIDELEESTANGDTFSLPLFDGDAQRGLPADIADALDALGELTTDEEPVETIAPPAPTHLPPMGSHGEPDVEIVSAALDSIDGLFGVAELDEAAEETVEEVILVEPMEERSVDEDLTEDIISADELDVFFEEATPPAEEEETAEEPISADELDAFFEEATPADEEEETAEKLISTDELDASFNEAEPEAPAEEQVDESETEAAISEEDLYSFFEVQQRDDMGDFFNEEPDPIAEQMLAETSVELPDEPLYEPAEARDLLSDEPDEEPAQAPIELADEVAMDEVTLPEEREKAPAAPANPLDPFSEEQLEHMLSPTEEQAAEEASSQQAPHYTPEVVELDSATPAVAESLAEDELVLSQPATPTGYAIPTELTQARRGSGKGSLLWGMGIALMCGALVLQYLYYFRLQLVENPQLRPLLTTMCEVTGCKLPPRRDLGRIELSEHLMQFHPNYEQSLLITATLANRAEFAQPYPLIEVLMTDIEQRVVARRHFTPQQYIPKLTSDSFPANSEIPLMLEVVDPGNNAVGFEFRFY